MKWLRVSALFLSVCLVVATASLPVTADIKWRSGGPSVTPQMDGEQLVEELTQLSRRPEERRVIVHLDGPVDPQQRAQLAAAGLSLLSYLGDHAYFAHLDRTADASRLATNDRVVAVEPIQAVRKLHPDLARGIVRPWSVIGASDQAVESKPETNPLVAVYVMFHPDVDLRHEGGPALKRHNADVRSWLETINGAVVHLRAEAVAELAAEDVVMYVEPPLPRMDELNDSNRPRVGADVLQGVPYGIDGSGVTVMVYDGGRMADHGDFGDRLTIGAGDTAGISDHATHVGGTIGGDGSGSGGQYKGMAPGVDFISYGFEQDGGLSEGFLYTDPGDLEDDYTEAITVYGADISNNSIGTNTAPNGFPCEWEGNYGATGALIDSIAAGAIGAPFRIVWANGNERQGSARCGSTYLTTAPPACAKGHITVGALNSNDDSVTDFTSWGPCDDGRLKPDVSGPGCQSDVDNGVTSTSSSGGYNTKCGTSMASPTVCGVGALLLQHYRDTFPGRDDFRNSTLKTILAHTAEDIQNLGPDFQTGYGSVRAVPAADLISEERFIEAEVGQGEIYSFVVSVGAGATEMKATLAWDDPPGMPGVDPVLVNDLDVRVVGPDSTVYFPWTLDPANPGDPAVRTQPNSVDNLEQVLVSLPGPGVYRVEIEGVNIAQGPKQVFSAAASPTLFNCASAGFVSASAGRVACESDFVLQVIDCDLNLSETTIETVSITVVSDTDTTGETLVLTETDAASAQFQAPLTVSETEAPGVLEVSEGDTITATYIDADDGAGGTNVTVQHTLTVDCTAPLVTDVSMIEVLPREATVGIDLDEDAQITVGYGTSCASLDSTVVSGNRTDSHQVTLRPLVDDTQYYFAIEEAVDEAGNVSSDDNGGNCYGFITPEVPDFFSEQFSEGLDLAGLTLTFQPNGSNDFYSLCGEQAVTEFPTDPTGGTDSGLGDDQPTSFDLTGGAQVLLYGEAYGTVHVGPNGYVTFGGGDSDYTETFDDHFSQPRIAALFDDLNPNDGGSISWKQTEELVAVTWQDIPEYSSGGANVNSFQIEMFFDGRIRLTWLEINVADALAGISAGTGLDPDFLESDLSGAGPCEPRAPVAMDIYMETMPDIAVRVNLVAQDDGQPDPLTYRITALPSYGTLVDDGTAAQITSVPYDLVAGGNNVTFTPGTGFYGTDYFSYVADDGGTGPKAGVSNTATVGVHVEFEGLVYRHYSVLEFGDPGWAGTGAWAYGTPTGGGSNDADPTAGYTGTKVFGYNLDGDYENNMGVETLTSTVMNLAFATDTQLEFRRWLGIDSADNDNASIQISTDGSSWTTIWEHTGEAISESDWSRQRIDISSIADEQANVSLRWTLGPTDASGTYPGWNIDDIRVRQSANAVCVAPPLEVPNVVMQRSGGLLSVDTLDWDPATHAGGEPPVYDVLRSDDGTDFSAAVCLETADGSDTEADVSSNPAIGGVWYYLIRASNGCGVGSLGQDSGANERTASACN